MYFPLHQVPLSLVGGTWWVMLLSALWSQVCSCQPHPGAPHRPSLLLVGQAEGRGPGQALEVAQDLAMDSDGPHWRQSAGCKADGWRPTPSEARSAPWATLQLEGLRLGTRGVGGEPLPVGPASVALLLC